MSRSNEDGSMSCDDKIALYVLFETSPVLGAGPYITVETFVWVMRKVIRNSQSTWVPVIIYLWVPITFHRLFVDRYSLSSTRYLYPICTTF